VLRDIPPIAGHARAGDDAAAVGPAAVLDLAAAAVVGLSLVQD